MRDAPICLHLWSRRGAGKQFLEINITENLSSASYISNLVQKAQ